MATVGPQKPVTQAVRSSRSQRPKVAIIIPAFNEEGRIARVMRAACTSKLGDEVIVVSDGSWDRTAEVAKRVGGARVIDLKQNVGKGGAMAAGVEATDAAIIAFIDADLDGLRPEHIDRIIRPLLDDSCEMCIGVFRGGKFWSDTAQRITPYISGQRAMKRWLFKGVPYMTELRMGVEVTINSHAKRVRARVLRVVLHGVSNCHKERKLGIVKGMQARAKMYQEILHAKVKVQQKRRRQDRNWHWR